MALEELPNARGDDIDLLGGQLGAHRKREDLVTDPLGRGQLRIAEPEPLVRPHRLGPVHQGLDPLSDEVIAERAAPRRPDDVVLEAVDPNRFVEARQAEVADAR